MGPKAEEKDYAELKTSTVLAELGQALVTLSQENTKRLLYTASETQRRRREDAAAILARLEELNPAVARQFQPKLDALDSLSLRMVLPSDALPKSTNTVDIPSYIIVSYCWHYPEWPLAPAAKPIAHGWEISKPMVDSIMGLRQTPDEGVWLDKLCINQEDDDEKRGHIAAMDIVYQSARRLIILLEDVQLTKEQTVAGLTYARFYQDLCDEVKERGLEGEEKSNFIDEYFPRRERELRAAGNGSLIDGIRDFAMNILDGRWYTRAWCAHESRVTVHQKINNPLFLCFDHEGRVLSFEFRFIFYLSIYLHDTEPDEEEEANTSLAALESMNDPQPKTLAQFRFRIQRLNGTYEPEGSAMQHVVHILSFGCLKRGDLMSIALNTSGIPLSFVGEVTSVDDVIWIFSLLVLATDDLVPLITIDAAGARRIRIAHPDGPSKNVISWVPILNQGIVDDKIPLPSRETITAVAGDYIELDLLLFKALPCTASEESQKIAARLIKEHDLHAIALEMLADAGPDTKRNRFLIAEGVKKATRDRAGPMAVFHKLWLAYALDCGLDWALGFPDAMRDNTSSEAWNYPVMGISSNPKLTSTAESFLRHFFPDQKDYDAKSVEYLRGIIRFLTTLFDPHLPFFTVAPRRLPLGKGNHAFISCTSNKAWIAVPACIAHLPAHYPRAWSIEPFDPQGEPEHLPEDHLPDLDRIYPRDAKAEDIFPIMTSDYEDRRAPRDDHRGTWRLRRRVDIIGFKGWSLPLREEDFPPGGEIVYLKKQKVYGADDYDWGLIGEATKKLKLEPETKTEGEGPPEKEKESEPAGVESTVAGVVADLSAS